MTVSQRAAALAAAFLALAGLAGLSAPGQAAGLPAPAAGQTAQTDPVQVVPAPAPVAALPVAAPVAALPVQAAPDAAPVAQVPASQTPAGFGSLDDAIAAQDRSAALDPAAAAVRCLAGAIWFEAKGEPVEGQLAVAEVIVNRARSGRFPPDVCGVVTQRGQFSFVRGGAVPAVDTSRAGYRLAVAVARVALADAWHSGAPRALFFHARHEGVGARMTRIAAIGNHVFYR